MKDNNDTMRRLTDVTEFRLKLYPKNFYLVREFYEKKLGFPIINEWDRGETNKGVMFSVGGAILELLSSGDEHRPVTGASVSLAVSDVWKLWEALKDTGNLTHTLRDNEWGDTSFCMADPDGFEITFFTKHEK